MVGEPPDPPTVYHTDETGPFDPAQPPERPPGAACAAVQGPPRVFVLCDEDGDVIAYGMTLPDGSAVTVQWLGNGHGSLGVWSSPGVPARLWSCAIAWFDRPSVPAQPL